MNSSAAKYLAIVFAACFIALQFHSFNYPEPTQKDNQPQHVEQILLSTSHSVQNLYDQQLCIASDDLVKQEELVTQQKQYINQLLHNVVHPFVHFISACIDALPLMYQHRDWVLFKYLQRLIHNYEFSAVLISFFLPSVTLEPIPYSSLI